MDDASRIARTSALISVGCVAVAASGAFIALLTIPQLGLLIAGLGLTFAALYGIAWRRASAARSAIRSGQFREVTAKGWCRPPDGCNYALFATSGSEEPDAVLRLPLRRELKRSADAWLAGNNVPSLLGGVGLLNEDGLLATGRIVSERTARKRWARREKEPGRMVQRPPEGWYPPAAK